MIKIIRLIRLKFKFSSNNTITDFLSISKKASLSECHFEKKVMIAPHASLSNCSIGYLTSIGRNTKITHATIGRFCAISWDTTINAINHPYNRITISAFPYVPHIGNFVKQRNQTIQRVIIKNDVWIGANSVIMPGLTIGNGAIIGAGSVVTKNIPDYAIVAGVPAKIINYRFSKDIITRLIKLNWWNLDRDIIKQNISLFQNTLTIDQLEKLEQICNS